MNDQRSAAKNMGKAQSSSSIRAGHEEGILAAAEAVFAERGFNGATTAEIAARAGLPKSNLHYYFPTKTKLYRRVLEGVLNAWLSAADTFESDPDAGGALARYIAAKMDLARDRPQGSRIFASEILRGAPEIQDFLETTLTQWVKSRGAVVERWIAEGVLKPIDPKTLFFMIWASTQHYADFAHQIAALNGGLPLSEAAFGRAKDEVVAIIVSGVLAQSAH
jgi:TetR/AcrR family transcriptional regulator